MTSKYMIDLVYIIDMSLMFFTSFRNKQRKEIFTNMEIFKHHLKSQRFMLDFLALLCIQIIVS